MHTVIIGNGIAGITVARYLRKAGNDPITIISSENKYFFSRTALMYVYMGHMKFENIKPYEDWFWEKNSLDLIQAHVTEIDFQKKKLVLNDENSLHYDRLILACGSKPAMLTVQGMDLAGVQGLNSWQDLELMEKNTRHCRQAVVVGGGLIGMEMSEMLMSRGIQTTMLVLEKNCWNNVLPDEESELITRHIRSHGVQVVTGTQLAEAKGANRVQCAITEDGTKYDCDFLGIAIGVKPNIDWLRRSMLHTHRGILVNSFFETNIENVYAIGDCAEFVQPAPGNTAIEQLWYTGKMHGQNLAAILLGKRKPYDRGIWFNSAKFFDIEYQVYGNVPPHLPAGMRSLYWQHHSGKKAIRITYEAAGEFICGIQVLGMRYRHEVCEQWITTKKTVTEILPQLPKANFDGEFQSRHEEEIRKLFDSKTKQVA